MWLSIMYMLFRMSIYMYVSCGWYVVTIRPIRPIIRCTVLDVVCLVVHGVFMHREAHYLGYISYYMFVWWNTMNQHLT